MYGPSVLLEWQLPEAWSSWNCAGHKVDAQSMFIVWKKGRGFFFLIDVLRPVYPGEKSVLIEHLLFTRARGRVSEHFFSALQEPGPGLNLCFSHIILFNLLWVREREVLSTYVQ